MSKDCILSVHDPEMRHGRKSSRKRFDGHKGEVVVGTDSQMIAAVEVLAGNAWDSAGALELVKRSEAVAGVPAIEAMGDAAYGYGGTRQAFADAGRTLNAKVPVRPNTARFPKEDFRRTSGLTCRISGGEKTQEDGVKKPMLPPDRQRQDSHLNRPFSVQPMGLSRSSFFIPMWWA